MHVILQFLVHRFKKHFIGNSSNIETGLIQDSNDALMRLLHQVTNDTIVEIFHVLPSDSFPQVFFLFLKKIGLENTNSMRKLTLGVCVFYLVPSEGWKPSISKYKIEETSLTQHC